MVIVGGGAAGVTVGARLGRAGLHDVALIEPSDRHYYQPLWTLVGAGVVPAAASVRPERRVMPHRARWVRDRAAEIDPDRREVTTEGGLRLGYDVLVVAAGIQLDWDAVPGLSEGIERGEVASNYRFDLAPRNWQRVHSFGGGTAVFAGVAGPHKCGGAIQKATYLAADEFRRRQVLDAETLQHRRYPEVFALGDCSGAPNAKTGAAVRKQAPVVADNLRSVLEDRQPQARYDGYSSCPIVTGYGKLVLAEFDYSGRPHKTIPLIDTARERSSMWLLKRYGLPFMYWHLMLRGRA